MKKIIYFGSLYFLIFILTSCFSYRKLSYLQNVEITNNDSTIINNSPEYKIQSSDKLYIRIITQNEKLNTLFNPMTANTSAAATNESSIYYQSYIVNDSGSIELPIIKKIKVSDMTLFEVQSVIQDSASKYFNDIQVVVKLAMIKFTLLGELRSPGIKTSYDTKISLLEALSYGGDITYNGNRKNILIIRPTPRGSKTFSVDVTKNDFIKSENFYILPNDIVYVPPLRSTLFRERSKDFIFIIPTIATTITTIILLLKTL